MSSFPGSSTYLYFFQHCLINIFVFFQEVHPHGTSHLFKEEERGEESLTCPNRALKDSRRVNIYWFMLCSPASSLFAALIAVSQWRWDHCSLLPCPSIPWSCHTSLIILAALLTVGVKGKKNKESASFQRLLFFNHLNAKSFVRHSTI